MDILQTYQTLENELAGFIGPVKFSSEINLRLERMTQLMKLLGNPQNDYRIVHIGGTSGKGSTATMTADLLEAAGHAVGLHTSPHLQILNERHRINGRYAPTTKLAAVWREMQPALETVRRTSPFGPPSYFEVQVALSLCLFRAEKVAFAVVEVGLGGTLDATNIVPAEVAVLTNVGLDHTEILGDTVAEITRDKSGIIKPGQTVVTGASQDDVREIIAARCRQQGAELWRLGDELTVDVDEHGRATVYLPTRTMSDIELGLPGRFQAQNAALALAAVEALDGITISKAQAKRGLKNSRLAGRVEQVQTAPRVLLDGAHNPDKIRAALSALHAADGKAGRTITVLGLKKGKNAADILPPVLKVSDGIIFTAFRPKGLWTAVDPHELAAHPAVKESGVPTAVIDDPDGAVEAAVAQVDAADTVWVTGSLYLVGDVRGRWFPLENLLHELETTDE